MSTHCSKCFGQGHKESSCDTKLRTKVENVYVVLKKRQEAGIFLPNFESFKELPELTDPKHKLLTLTPSDCADVARFNLSDDKSYLVVNHYRVSNIYGQLVEQLTETYTLPRHGPNEKG